MTDEPVKRKKKRRRELPAVTEPQPQALPVVLDENGQPVKVDRRRKEFMDPAERERRRQNYLKLRAEGRIGPQFGVLSRKGRNLRAAELIAVEAQRHAHKILRALLDGLKPNQPISIRLKAAEQFIRIEQQEAELLMAEERHELAKLTPEEITQRIAEIALDLGLISNDPGAIEGVAVEVASGPTSDASGPNDASEGPG